MPDSDQIEKAYEAILEKAGIDNPELLEVYINFSKSITNNGSNEAPMSIQFVSPQDKNKIVSYRYIFDDEQVEGPADVTLSYCYVHQLSFKYRPTNGELQGYVSVQSTRSTTAHKSFAIDKAGNIKTF